MHEGCAEAQYEVTQGVPAPAGAAAVGYLDAEDSCRMHAGLRLGAPAIDPRKACQCSQQQGCLRKPHASHAAWSVQRRPSRCPPPAACCREIESHWLKLPAGARGVVGAQWRYQNASRRRNWACGAAKGAQMQCCTMEARRDPSMLMHDCSACCASASGGKHQWEHLPNMCIDAEKGAIRPKDDTNICTTLGGLDCQLPEVENKGCRAVCAPPEPLDYTHMLGRCSQNSTHRVRGTTCCR